MLATHAVGIDLGTTYSSIAYLNEHGEPVTLPNQEGELSTPSVVLFDQKEVIVGTEALRNAILHPERVVQNAKRFMGDHDKSWVIDGKPYKPVDISTFILKKLIGAAQEQIGSIEQAVITVPAQFSDSQRQATVEAGHRAGLARVDIINEPVAAALCYVLGTEGLWFTELADEQRILVYDLGGGTFDLSLVKYQKNEVSVIAAGGDLNLGGIDWNQVLEEAVALQFQKEFGKDPRKDPSSRQALALEVEQTKRSLSVRPRAAVTCQHAGQRNTYQITQEQFEKLARKLVERTAEITQRMLKDHKLGWAKVDVVLTVGGASRMPMIRNRLKQLSGRTLNTSLSPDQSIAHGATYYAGMLLSNQKFAKSILTPKASKRLSQVKQRSVNARGLGILVRDKKIDQRVPVYLIPPNTPLPAAVTQEFGTVVANQRDVHLQIIESGTAPDKPPVKLGSVRIDDLPPNLPEGSIVAVTIRYDEQARVHVSARDSASGKQAIAEIIRQENLLQQLETAKGIDSDVAIVPPPLPKIKQTAAPGAAPPAAAQKPQPAAKSAQPAPKSPQQTASKPAPSMIVEPKRAPRSGAASPARQHVAPISAVENLEDASRPIPLCNTCGHPLDPRGQCAKCGPAAKKPAKPAPAPTPRAQAPRPTAARPPEKSPAPRRNAPPAKPQNPEPTEEDEFWRFVE